MGWQDDAVVKPQSAGASAWQRDEVVSAPAKQPSAPSVAPTDSQRLQASVPARMVQGVRDVIDAGAQFATRAIPEGVVNAVNRGTAAVNNLPFIGPATIALGMTPATPQQIDQGIRSNEQEYQQARMATAPKTLSSLVTGKTDPGIDWARIGGNVLATAPAAMALPAGGASMLGRVGAGVAGGAAMGAMQPVIENQDNFVLEKAKQMGVGGAVGGAMAPVAAGVARIISPQTRPQVQMLRDAGVTMTPGQIMGGTLQRTEEKLSSLPILGDAIKGAQRSAVEDLNRAAYGRALNPIGGQVPKDVGREGVGAVYQQLQGAYENLLPRLQFKADPGFVQDLTRIRGMASTLPEAESAQFERILATHIGGKLTPAGLASGTTIKQVESELGTLARGYRGDQSFDKRQLGKAIEEVQSSIRSALQRTNPGEAAELAAINEGYANFARIRNAAARMGSKEGVFSAEQLSGAVRAKDSSVDKGAFARGNAMMQDLSDAGVNVLGSKYPDSGSIGRLALGAGALGSGALSPAIPAGLGLASIPYLPGMRRLTQAALMERPQGAGALAELTRTGLPRLGVLSAPALYDR